MKRALALDEGSVGEWKRGRPPRARSAGRAVRSRGGGDEERRPAAAAARGAAPRRWRLATSRRSRFNAVEAGPLPNRSRRILPGAGAGAGAAEPPPSR